MDAFMLLKETLGIDSVLNSGSMSAAPLPSQLVLLLALLPLSSACRFSYHCPNPEEDILAVVSDEDEKR